MFKSIVKNTLETVDELLMTSNMATSVSEKVKDFEEKNPREEETKKETDLVKPLEKINEESNLKAAMVRSLI